ncbi:MAG: dihydrodipicolinate synthase family protein [Flavobacteriales bacterium]|nr:MAG: dihydrodipicolinate synthase family protein [Flavobacteriales bacterium]
MKINWKGVFPAVTTKFTEDNRLDIEWFLKNIDAQITAGVDGIILGGTLGEASGLEDEEKYTLLKSAAAFLDGKVPVIMNITAKTTEAAIESAQKAEKFGANGLMMLPPTNYYADDRETIAYFKAVANATSLPIMIYNNPVDYKIEVTIKMFEALSVCKNIQAVKESTRDISNITRMKNTFGNRFSILCGVDTLALESLLMGADGWVAGLVCAFPKETVAIYRLTKAGRHQEALEIYRWFLPLLELDINSKLVQNIKLAEVATGLGTEHVRAPRLPLIGEERSQVLAIIEKAMASRPTLPEYLNINHQELVNV